MTEDEKAPYEEVSLINIYFLFFNFIFLKAIIFDKLTNFNLIF